MLADSGVHLFFASQLIDAHTRIRGRAAVSASRLVIPAHRHRSSPFKPAIPEAADLSITSDEALSLPGRTSGGR